MTIKVIGVGKLKEDFLKDAQKEYLKRLSRFCNVQVLEIEEEKAPDSASPAQEERIRLKEAERIKKAVTKNMTTIALDLEGSEKTSVEFSDFISRLMLEGKSEIAFIIGGSTGLDPSVTSQAHHRLCLSKMTFPHQLARIILLEQVYRAFKILNNEVYHK